MSSLMGYSGRLLTIYSALHKAVAKISAVTILFFNISYKHLFVLIRLSQQPPIRGLSGGLNRHLI